MKSWKTAVIAMLLGFTIFSSYKYFSSIKERFDLFNEMKEVNEQVVSLQKERTALLQDLEGERRRQESLSEENSGLQGRLQAAQDAVVQMRADVEAAQQTLEELNNQFSVAQAENTALAAKLADMKAEAALLSQEKETLKARLGSLSELKKAIAELKKKVIGARAEIRGRLRKDELIIGNGGYIVKDGRPTFPTRVKIEVVPLPE